MREGLPQHNFHEQELPQTGLSEMRESISYWHSVLQRSKELARDALIKTAAVGLLLQFSTLEQAKAHGQRLAHNQTNLELPKKPERYPIRDVETVRQELLTDTAERFFFLFRKLEKRYMNLERVGKLAFI